VSDLAERLAALVSEAREHGQLAELGQLLRAALREAQAPQDRGRDGEVPGRFGLIGDSAAMRAVFDLIARVAAHDVPVLIEGETGTGKELVARALHEQSPRASRPFLAVNCAAVPANLLESELFGHKKGSFTHAIADRPGHFVSADGGTLFLDEIGDMPLEMQAKLLRVLETGEVRPVGSSQSVKVDVRTVAATNRELAALVAERRFREDLFYRLNVVRIALPPLRERAGDVALLLDHFLGRFRAPEVALVPDAREALERYRWPGNVRQLENEIRRAAALARGSIELADLSPEIRG
jgi:transcriptional regulator with GAF, ATPase, and Fis domain